MSFLVVVVISVMIIVGANVLPLYVVAIVKIRLSFWLLLVMTIDKMSVVVSLWMVQLPVWVKRSCYCDHRARLLTFGYGYNNGGVYCGYLLSWLLVLVVVVVVVCIELVSVSVSWLTLWLPL